MGTRKEPSPSSSKLTVTVPALRTASRHIPTGHGVRSLANRESADDLSIPPVAGWRSRYSLCASSIKALRHKPPHTILNAAFPLITRRGFRLGRVARRYHVLATSRRWPDDDGAPPVDRRPALQPRRTRSRPNRSRSKFRPSRGADEVVVKTCRARRRDERDDYGNCGRAWDEPDPRLGFTCSHIRQRPNELGDGQASDHRSRDSE